MNGVQEWLRFFEQVSCFYKESMSLSWEKYPNHITDIWDSLAIFLEVYAFERQGRRPDYFHAAVDALVYCKEKNNSNMNQNVISDIWQRFSKLLNDQKLNHQNNPLYPSTDPDNKKLEIKSSVIEVVINKRFVENDLTFSTFFQEQIKQDNNIQKAFDLLTSIRGLGGGKVASFYLRDLAVVMKINLDGVEKRYLLQPIDIWVARTIILLSGDEFSSFKEPLNKNGLSGLNDKEIKKLATWIVKSCMHGINPEPVNMGIWYFCSQMAISEYRLNRVLQDLNELSYAKKLVDEHSTWIRKACQNCQNFA